MHPSWFYYAMHTIHTMHPSWFHLPASRLIVQIFCTLWKSARPTNRSSLQMSTYVKLFENVKSFENLVVQIQIPQRCHWIMFGLKRIVVLLRKGPHLTLGSSGSGNLTRADPSHSSIVSPRHATENRDIPVAALSFCNVQKVFFMFFIISVFSSQ